MYSVINDFRFLYRPFSNFHLKPVQYEDLLYPSNENAYQAAKTLDKESRMQFTNIAPMEAKRKGKKIKLRDGWDDIKYGIMEDLCRQKFQNGAERELLLSTDTAILIEGNYWHDNIWGKCYGLDFKNQVKPITLTPCEKCKDKVGQNNLGIILMKIRGELNAETIR